MTELPKKRPVTIVERDDLVSVETAIGERQKNRARAKTLLRSRGARAPSVSLKSNRVLPLQAAIDSMAT
jgi:hypothetical protein